MTTATANIANIANIATTIRDQIGRNTLMCIGASMLAALPETETTLGGLQFKIARNPKIAGGWVSIYLNANDTYTVKIQNLRGKVVAEMSDVYCDNLGGPDGVIEVVTG